MASVEQARRTRRPKSITEAPITLEAHDAVRVHGLRDQVTLWGSLGVSLLIPATAVFVIQPTEGTALSLPAALCVVILGSIVGSALLAAAAVTSSATGAPSMVMLRGLLGRRMSYLPSVLNIAQCFGWAALEIFVIAAVGSRLTGEHTRLWWTLGAALVAGALAVRPLHTAAIVRRYLTWLVIAATAYLLIAVINAGVHMPATGSWQLFWPAFDVVVAMPVSWAVLAGDWSRHSRSNRATLIGVGGGYAIASTVCFIIGVLAVFSSQGLAVEYTASGFLNGLMILPVGALALIVLAVDELDEAFANVYSTSISLQNLQPRIDRRVAAVLITAAAAACALLIDIESYETFLLVIGAVFVPLAAMLVTDWFVVSPLVRSNAHSRITPWQPQRMRWMYVMPWVFGIFVYSRMSPGAVPGWSQMWSGVAAHTAGLPTLLGSATLTTVVFTAAATVGIGALHHRIVRPHH